MRYMKRYMKNFISNCNVYSSHFKEIHIIHVVHKFKKFYT